MSGAFIKSALWVNEIIVRWSLLEPGAPGAIPRRFNHRFNGRFN